MKKLIFINGPAGIGKTMTCRNLLMKMDNAAWLESDWCWSMNMYPSAFNPETEAMVVKNISFILRNYLEYDKLDYVIFNWVLHRKHLFDKVIANIGDIEYQLCPITLMASETEHLRRMIQDGRDDARIQRSLDYRKLYEKLSNPIIDTTQLSIDETSDKIIEIIKQY